ncbi:MAG: insulinase family protein [Clostridiales bacterium]|nr:insulinase family protein [Clostridiales bacterium]
MTVKKYKNGLTVIIERNDALRSVTSGIMVGTGSAYETRENNGISHFIEHMQFKGTEKRSAEDIVNAFDEAGASFNAFTAKEYTCYYFKSIDEKIEDCFEVLSDLFLHSVYDDTELDRERHVIIEEINMSLDDPDGVCYDVLYGTMFKGALGMEILGPKENVSRFGKADILAYKSTNYTPSNTVVAFVGNITEETALGLVEKYLSEWVNAEYKAPPVKMAETFNVGYGSFIKDFEQSEISIAFPALSVGDERTATLSALDYIFGTGMGSRLFRRLREQMGLVYSVYCQPWFGRDNGVFSICANVNVTNVEKSIKAIKEEIDKLLKDGVTESETNKAKTQLKVSALFGKENPMSYMLALMRRRALLDEDYDLDVLIARIDRITPKDIDAMAHEILERDAAFAYAGKKPPKAIDKIFYNAK